jgi:G:T/U-mismatch repair DNA glycosylase
MGSDPRVLIVGINPSSAKIGNNTTWRRLPSWADALGLKIFSFTNCIYTPGPYKFADVDLDLIRSCTEGHSKVVALGNFASKVLQKINVNHFTLPHPSGLNRKLNDRRYELEQLVKCKEYIYD